MKTFTTKSELSQYLANERSKGKSIGFVPTMGALHKGHISLINKAKEDGNLVVASIFVNPTQFNNKVDLEKYPRTLEVDSQLLSAASCDVLFAPALEEMYRTDEHFDYTPSPLSTTLEGEFRPGHFKGVAQIVSKLFQIVQPHKAYFGLKDYQQLLVIKEMVAKQNLPIQIIPCPIFREENGLAMSSRNERLSKEHRLAAGIIFESLSLMKAAAQNNSNGQSLINIGMDTLKKNPEMEVEYLKIVNTENLQPLETITDKGKAIILFAGNFGGVRLIDNLLLQ